MAALDQLAGLKFRASDRYELVLHDRLRPEEQARFADLTRDPDHWGVLRPRGAGNYRAIDRDTALLLFALREPGTLPAYVLETVDPQRVVRQVRAMVLDGILEAEDPGGAAVDWLGDAGDETQIDDRSLAALRYGAALGLDDAEELSVRLYGYGSEPLSHRLVEQLCDRRRILAFLGLERGGDARRQLPAGWSIDAADESAWIFLRRRGPRPPTRCKLYVAAAQRSMPEVLAAVVGRLADGRATSMKVGGRPVDLVRVDKIVVYFAALEDLQSFAACLAPAVRSLADATGRVSGIPFTADAGADGLLSWGSDPPDGVVPLEGTFSDSWRSWLTSRLASALVSLGTEIDPERRIRAAVERVALEGVDVTRWTPTAAWGGP